MTIKCVKIGNKKYANIQKTYSKVRWMKNICQFLHGLRWIMCSLKLKVHDPRL